MTSVWRCTPLWPAGHLPLKGGDWQFLRLDPLAALVFGKTDGDGQSPPLR
ncbi:lytic murein transglycosylase, partial [Mesorhizobium sp. M6A.T.Ca.TU.002.02.2.1]